MSASNGHRKVLEQRIASIDKQFKKCRRNGYHFYAASDKIEVYRHVEDRDVYIVHVKQCHFCKLWVYDYYDVECNYLYSRRDYPDGYLFEYDEDEGPDTKVSPRKVIAVELRKAISKGLSDLPEA